MSGKVYPLHGNQAGAVDPQRTVWLSASAGTGKTQVLSARVLRLLLQKDVEPSQILCLTFTKAGAAEMAVRVNEVLANWVRMEETALAADLQAIGAPFDAETCSRARTLFASVLDCPGGGLRIDTIHAFSQWLLSAFPEEAGLTPGTRAMEDRERGLLAREVLAEMLVQADEHGDNAMLDALADLSLRKGPDAVEEWLMRCAQARDAWFDPAAWVPPLRPRVNGLLGLSSDASLDDAVQLCTDQMFDIGSLQACLDINRQWSAKTGQANADGIASWIAAEPQERLEKLGDLYKLFFTAAGELRASKSQEKIDPSYPAYVNRVAESLLRVRELQALLDLAEWLTPALELGRTFALEWDEAKKREGLIDFDDQIRRASDLLNRSDLSDWIRYKLDRRFDHILVDEAQDTNEAQWKIINALTGDFFSGEGQRDGKMRTLFVVGDYKQAIFRFQGTSPENFARARERVREALAGAVANAQEGRGQVTVQGLLDLDLERSFRTAQKVLTFVDDAIAAIGPERFGLKDAPPAHVGEERPGLVTLWKPVSAQPDEADGEDAGDDGWLSGPERRLADRIAEQIRRWMRDGFPLVKGGHRDAGPGDIMILVRKRKDLAGLIVARLYAAGVPVAGVDRLRLGAPLAVKDVMAALSFAAQPLDDLNFANLLVSPLVSWSQQDLLDHGWREKRVRLWDHLRSSSDPFVRQTLETLGQLLALADYEPPQALIHWILSGPWRGRQKLVGRLGAEANDPLDELLNAALGYSATQTPSLQGFIQWFDSGEGELKREADSAGNLVRVMTVHGSKGLQAPIVILADAAGNPDTSPIRGLELEEQHSGKIVPLPSISKDAMLGRLADAQAQAAAEEREEHWRLLYVAMTRAEEALFIGGSLGLREEVPAPDSWFAQVSSLFPNDAIGDEIWGERREIGQLAEPVAASVSKALLAEVSLPDWAVTPIGPEPRPPRPLAPSSAGDDLGPLPPLPSGAVLSAVRRGTLIHRLLERLPEVTPPEREAAARRWLVCQAGDLDESARQDILQAAMQVLAIPEWTELFSSQALAEAPLAAIVGGQVISGTVDRLLVSAERIRVVDFKSTSRPPDDLSDIPVQTIRQMAAYVAALEVIYPGRTIEAAVLYTHAPLLLALPDRVLEPHKHALSPAQ